MAFFTFTFFEKIDSNLPFESNVEFYSTEAEAHVKFENADYFIFGIIQQHNIDFAKLFSEKTIAEIEQVLQSTEGGYSVIYFCKVTKEITVYRDFFGIKPLYYSVVNQHIIISNNLKPIVLKQKYQISLSYIKEYFCSDFNDNLSDKYTFFESIFKVLPGHKGTFVNFVYKEVPFFDLHNVTLKPAKKTFFEAACFSEYEADQIGTHLSGGLDSSSILVALTQNHKNDIKSFYFDGGSSANQEMTLAHQMAQQFGSDLSIIDLTKDSYNQIVKVCNVTFVPEVLVIPTYVFDNINCQATNLNVKHLFSGHGGDTIIGDGFNYFEELFENKNYDELNYAFKQYADVRHKSKASTYKASEFILHKVIKSLKKLNITEAIRLFYTGNSKLDFRFKLLIIKILVKIKIKQKIKIPSYFVDDVNFIKPEAPNYAELFFSEGNQFQKNQINSNFVSLGINALEMFDSLACHSGLNNWYPMLNKKLLVCSLHTDLKSKFYNGYGRGLLRQIMDKELPENIRLRTTKAAFDALDAVSFNNVWKSYAPKLGLEHRIWKIINKKAFDFAVSVLFDSKFTQNQKKEPLWFCSKVVSLAIWLDVLDAHSF